MATNAQLIERLDQWLRTERPLYYQYLQPPLSDEQLADFESFVGFSLPASFRELYSWKGGQSGVSPEPLYDGRAFMQLTELREGLRANNELREMKVFDEEMWWRPHWIPFLTDGGGNFLCFDAEGSFGGRAGQLISFRSENPARNIEFPDLNAFLSSLLEGFETAQRRGALDAPIEIPYPAGYPIRHEAESPTRRK